ncbi:peptide-methionine (S)-S-oxide reductase MsrA [Streptomyces sp. NPDC005708]|uniref:peptide-methionine (S)-S-oxide reductase MsrA n=1 Tax=Streptomyces sp. NPDC005708 TaxID=3154564 RepID=UPI0033FF7973
MAGGCFWGIQGLFRALSGVLTTRMGYSGGDMPYPTCHNHGSHAESIEITFDRAATEYRAVLEYFVGIRYLTAMNRQGNDVGTSYRSAIFYRDDEQRRVAEETIADVVTSGLRLGRVVTEVVPADESWETESEYQDYLQRFSEGYTCHFPRANWWLPKRANS